MIRPIVRLGAPVLKAQARAVEPADLASGQIDELINDLRDSLDKAGGVGLAAPQIGESIRVILAGSFPTDRSPDRPDVPTRAFINPLIVRASEETAADWEGCLSFLEFRVNVRRSTSISVEYLTPDGQPSRLEASGFFARVLQHEIDHLDGILTLDRAASPEDVERTDAPPAS